MTDQEVILWAEAFFFQRGRSPTHDELEAQGAELTQLIAVVKHFQNTGLTEAEESLLSPKQYLVARMLLNTSDRRSLRVKLKEASVSVKEFDDWKNSPRFVNFLRTQVASRFRDADITADLELIKNLEDGDLKSIMYYNQMTGRAASPETLNVQKVLATMMEILVKYVTADVLSKVAKELEDRLASSLAERFSVEVQESTPVRKRFALNVKTSGESDS